MMIFGGLISESLLEGLQNDGVLHLGSVRWGDERVVVGGEVVHVVSLEGQDYCEKDTLRFQR